METTTRDTKSLRILHIPAYALHGGCEKNCYHFIKGSPAYHHDIMVLEREGPMSSAWRGLGVDVKHLDILKKNPLSFGNALRDFLGGSKYDLAICWSTIRLPLQLHALNDVASKTLVYLGNPVGKNYNPWKDVLLSKVFRAKEPVKLMACSEYVSATYRTSPYFSSFPIEVSLNPVELPESAREEPSRERMIMGMVARLDPIKDHATVIRAFKIVHETHPATELHVVGDGKLRSSLEELAGQLGISPVVKFHGDTADVYSHLRSWNIFLYATTPDEGLGSAVAEAMANGLPCVLSDLPMLRELAPGPIAAWFQPFNAAAMSEQVSRLIVDQNLRRQMGSDSYRHAREHFGVKRFIGSYVAFV